MSHVKDAYIHDMEEAFEELRRSAANWKALKIATDIYPSWYHNHVLKLQRNSDDSLSRADAAPQSSMDPSSGTQAGGAEKRARPATTHHGQSTRARKKAKRNATTEQAEPTSALTSLPTESSGGPVRREDTPTQTPARTTSSTPSSSAPSPVSPDDSAETTPSLEPARGKANFTASPSPSVLTGTYLI